MALYASQVGVLARERKLAVFMGEVGHLIHAIVTFKAGQFAVICYMLLDKFTIIVLMARYANLLVDLIITPSNILVTIAAFHWRSYIVDLMLY